MKICFLSHDFPPATHWGGMGTFVNNLSSQLAEDGHEVFVISQVSPRQKKESCSKIKEVFVFRIMQNFETRFLNLVYFRLLGKLRRFLLEKTPAFWESLEWSFFAYLAFRKLHKKYQFDIVHAPEFNASLFFINFLAKDVLKIVTLLGSRELANYYNLYKNNLDNCLSFFLEKKAVAMADRLTVLSNAYQKKVGRRWLAGKREVTVIHGGVDCARFVPDDSVRIEKIILYAGRLERRKGVDILLKSFVEISPSYPEFSLFLIGRDSRTFFLNKRRVTFKQYLSSLKLSKEARQRIKVIPWLKQEDLRQYYQRSSFCVFPSRYEPFGYVILEAMACGRPVIASLKGGPREIIINNESGLLVKPSVQNLAEKIRFLIENKDKRKKLGRMARKRVEENFNLEERIKEWSAYYEDGKN